MNPILALRLPPLPKPRKLLRYKGPEPVMRKLSESSRDEPQIRKIFGTEVIEDFFEDLVWE
jgi:hypothetical protein